MKAQVDWIGVLLRVAVILGVGFMLAPLVFVVLNSFNASPLSKFPPESFSFRWYEQMFAWQPFADGFRNSVIVATLSTLLALAVGTPAAIALTRHQFRLREAMRGAVLTPLIFPRVALALGAYILFLQVGQALNARSALLGTPLALVLVHALLGLPLVVVIVGATLSTLDVSVEEAAEDLGANPAQTFLRVTYPLIRQALLVSAVFAFMFSFDEVETTFFLAPVSIRTLPVEMFIYLEREATPVVAALSTLLLFGTFVLVLLLAARLGVERLVGAVSRP